MQGACWLSVADAVLYRRQLCKFCVAVEPRAGEKTNPFRTFEREHAAAPGHDVDDQVGMHPVLELSSAHVEGLAADLPEQHIRLADLQFAPRKAHRRAAVAAAPGLMKHERPMAALQLVDQLQRRRRRTHA